MYFIYALTDPRTDEIRYVGMAKDLEQRFYEHVYKGGGGNREKDRWILQLLDDGLLPGIETLETVETKNIANEREAYWIQYYIEQGEPLTNILHHRANKTKRVRRPRDYYGDLGYASGPGYYCSEEQIEEELNIRAKRIVVNWDGSD